MFLRIVFPIGCLVFFALAGVLGAVPLFRPEWLLDAHGGRMRVLPWLLWSLVSAVVGFTVVGVYVSGWPRIACIAAGAISYVYVAWRMYPPLRIWYIVRTKHSEWSREDVLFILRFYWERQRDEIVVSLNGTLLRILLHVRSLPGASFLRDVHIIDGSAHDLLAELRDAARQVARAGNYTALPHSRVIGLSLVVREKDLYAVELDELN